MKNVTIFIKLVPGTHKLHLTDNEGHSGDAEEFFSDVNRGDKVIWKLAPDSGIDEITGIRAKDGNFNIFAGGGPKRHKDVWRGVVKGNACGEEDYNIDFKIGEYAFSVDPKIRVNT